MRKLRYKKVTELVSGKTVIYLNQESGSNVCALNPYAMLASKLSTKLRLESTYKLI